MEQEEVRKIAREELAHHEDMDLFRYQILDEKFEKVHRNAKEFIELLNGLKLSANHLMTDLSYVKQMVEKHEKDIELLKKTDNVSVGKWSVISLLFGAVGAIVIAALNYFLFSKGGQ